MKASLEIQHERRSERMKTTTKTVTELLETNDSPLPLAVIPNNMGINLCSVEALTWMRQDDGQLVSLTIHFLPTSTDNQTVAGAKLDSTRLLTDGCSLDDASCPRCKRIADRLNVCGGWIFRCDRCDIGWGHPQLHTNTREIANALYDMKANISYPPPTSKQKGAGE